MKKSDITASMLIIITCALLVIFLGLRSIDGYVGGGGTAPSSRFLSGREPMTCKKAEKGTEDSSGIEDRRYVYSFEADFNDLCSKANTELIPAGFVGSTIVDDTVVDKSFSEVLSSIRVYYLKGRFPRGPIWIYIYKNRQCIKLPNSNDYARTDKDSWVVVDIVYGRGWRWPF
jgi:hypothetical protein